MNKTIRKGFQVVKYIAGALLIGYLTLVLRFLYEQRHNEKPFTDKITDSFGGALYLGAGTVLEFVYRIFGKTIGTNSRDDS